MKPCLNLIVAVDCHGCIGKSGPEPLVWKQKADLQRFKKLTTGNVVIMGYNTFKSIGRALPNRANIVVSKRHLKDLADRDDVFFAESLEAAILLAETLNCKKTFLIGGGMLYNEAIDKDLIEKFYITVVKTKLPYDQHNSIVKFPVFSNDNAWEQEEPLCVDADDDNEFKTIFIGARRK